MEFSFSQKILIQNILTDLKADNKISKINLDDLDLQITEFQKKNEER